MPLLTVKHAAWQLSSLAYLFKVYSYLFIQSAFTIKPADVLIFSSGKQENMDVSAMLQELQAQYEAKLQV